MLLFATEGVRVLKKKVNETQVSKTVLSHLKVGLSTKKLNMIQQAAIFSRTLNLLASEVPNYNTRFVTITSTFTGHIKNYLKPFRLN